MESPFRWNDQAQPELLSRKPSEWGVCLSYPHSGDSGWWSFGEQAIARYLREAGVIPNDDFLLDNSSSLVGSRESDKTGNEIRLGVTCTAIKRKKRGGEVFHEFLFLVVYYDDEALPLAVYSYSGLPKTGGHVPLLLTEDSRARIFDFEGKKVSAPRI